MMDVVQNNVDDLNAVVTVNIKKEDYQEKYENSLKTAKKNVSLPGFRPGKVPSSIVKKKYGAAILAEEIDKLINEALQKHIQENELSILGNPLPKTADDKIDWENPSDMKFDFEIGLAPQFDVKLSGKNKFTFHKVKVDDELIDKQIEDYAKRFGKLTPVDVAEEKDMIWAKFTELDENDAPLEGGFEHSSTVAIEYLEDKDAKKKLTGLKAGDELIIDPKTISKGDADMGAMLGITGDQAKVYNRNVQLHVTEVKRMEPAEITQELIDKLYGEGTVNGEEELRTKVAEDLSKNFNGDSDRLFKRDVVNSLVEKLDLNLPDEFLKRWIMSTNKNELTMEQIESEYDAYAKNLRWQLIENKIVKDNELKVDHDELLAHTKELLAAQYAQYGMMVPVDEELTEGAKKALANQEDAQKIYEQMFEAKVMTHIKNTVKLEEKEMSFDDFLKEAQKN